MINKVLKYYLVQLVISFIVLFASVNIYSFFKGFNNYDTSRLLLLSIVGGISFCVLNAVINTLNFFFTKTQKPQIAYYLPAFIWFIISCFVFGSLVVDMTTENFEYLFLIIWVEPILFNVTTPYLLQKVDKN